MTNVIGNISESILEQEWNLDFYLKMAKQAFESSDYDQANTCGFAAVFVYFVDQSQGIAELFG